MVPVFYATCRASFCTSFEGDLRYAALDLDILLEPPAGRIDENRPRPGRDVGENEAAVALGERRERRGGREDRRGHGRMDIAADPIEPVAAERVCVRRAGWNRHVESRFARLFVAHVH